MSEPSDLLVEKSGGRLTLTLNRPAAKNALTKAMVEGLTQALDDATFDDELRVVHLRTSARDFCSGIDLVESNKVTTAPRTGHMQRRMLLGAHRLIRTMHEHQLPIVSSVSGWAAGIGNALALSADVVIADTTAKFWVPMVAKGFSPDSANTYLLPRLIGTARAKEMILRAKPVPAERALQWGMISEAVEPEKLQEASEAVLTEFEQAATVSVGLAKTLIHRNIDADLTSALQNEGIYVELAVRTNDFKEGIKAFREKRPTAYTGW